MARGVWKTVRMTLDEDLVEREGVERILSFDRGFDEFSGIDRIGT